MAHLDSLLGFLFMMMPFDPNQSSNPADKGKGVIMGAPVAKDKGKAIAVDDGTEAMEMFGDRMEIDEDDDDDDDDDYDYDETTSDDDDDYYDDSDYTNDFGFEDDLEEDEVEAENKDETESQTQTQTHPVSETRDA